MAPKIADFYMKAAIKTTVYRFKSPAYVHDVKASSSAIALKTLKDLHYNISKCVLIEIFFK